MLTEDKIKALKDLNLDDATINNIDDYNDSNQTVVFKDGSIHQLVECYVRCMGYYRPVSQFNKGKQAEFNERQWFVEAKAKINENKVA